MKCQFILVVEYKIQYNFIQNLSRQAWDSQEKLPVDVSRYNIPMPIYD